MNDLQEHRRLALIDSEASRMQKIADNFLASQPDSLGEAARRAYLDMAVALRILADSCGVR